MIDLIRNLFNSKQTDFTALVKQGAIIVDVRTNGEFQGGHIRNSRNIPLDQLKTKVAELKKMNKTIITVCRSGARSRMAKSILSAGGLVVINGGAWNMLEKRI